MKLFYSPSSPFVRKVMVVAHEVGLADTIEKIPASAHPVNRDAALVAKNPLGKVPSAILEDGSVIYDSRVIAEYLDTKAGGRLFPKDGAARWRALAQQALGDGMLDAGVLIRYERTARPAEIQWDTWDEKQRQKMLGGLDVIEGMVPQLQQLTIGSIAIGCALGYLDFRFNDINWRVRCPEAARWYADFSARPSMQATKPE